MKTTYSTKEASEITGASRQIIRTYTGTYARYFSTEGAPDSPGQPRSFTRDDLRLIRFIYVATKERGLNHNQVQEHLAAGELEAFEWEAPEEGEESTPGATGNQPIALVPVAQLQAAMTLLQDAQRREQEAREQARNDQREMQAEMDKLRQALGRAEGALEALRDQQADRTRSWWSRILGR
jgi:DNA-binding transcriptional MerR regulator